MPTAAGASAMACSAANYPKPNSTVVDSANFGIVFSLLLLRRNALVQIFSLRNSKIFWLLDHRYGTQMLYSPSVLWMLMFLWSERWDSKSIPRQSRGLKPPRISWRLVGVSQKYSSALMHCCSVVLRPSRRLVVALALRQPPADLWDRSGTSRQRKPKQLTIATGRRA